jgi:hypothetical protein
MASAPPRPASSTAKAKKGKQGTTSFKWNSSRVKALLSLIRLYGIDSSAISSRIEEEDGHVLDGRKAHAINMKMVSMLDSYKQYQHNESEFASRNKEGMLPLDMLFHFYPLLYKQHMGNLTPPANYDATEFSVEATAADRDDDREAEDFHGEIHFLFDGIGGVHAKVLSSKGSKQSFIFYFLFFWLSHCHCILFRCKLLQRRRGRAVEMRERDC